MLLTKVVSLLPERHFVVRQRLEICLPDGHQIAQRPEMPLRRRRPIRTGSPIGRLQRICLIFSPSSARAISSGGMILAVSLVILLWETRLDNLI
jgi:hypothetical protein